MRHFTHRLVVLGATLLFAQLAYASPIAWPGDIQWTPFETALERAPVEGKAVCVVVYADWCPKCRNLAPVFAGPPVTDAAAGVIMVLQNSEERPEWLQKRFGDLGNYVPRLFFLKPDGTVNRELVSGHPRFPFFYTPAKVDVLVEQLRKAASSAAPPAPAAPAPPPVAPAKATPVSTAPPAAEEGGLFADKGVLVLLGLLVAIGFVVARLGRKEEGDGTSK